MKPTIESVFTDEGVTRTRKVITMYKAGEVGWGLAMFRTTALHMLYEIAVRGVEHKKLTAAQRRYIAPWLVDRNPMFREFFAELNRALGYTFIEIPDC